MTTFDPTKPCCLRADLDKPADQRRKVRILATDLPGEWPICGLPEGTSIVLHWAMSGEYGHIGTTSPRDLVNIPPAPAPRCEPPPEFRDKDGWHWCSNGQFNEPSWWDGKNRRWFKNGEMFSPDIYHRMDWRYHSPCVPGPRYGEADPRDAEIERLKSVAAELFDDVAAKAETIERLDARLAAARQPIQVTDGMVEAAKKKWETCYLRDAQSALRDIIEAALAAKEG